MSVRGILTGADFEGALKAALIAATIFYGFGLLLGELARRVIEENVARELAMLDADIAKTQPPTASKSA